MDANQSSWLLALYFIIQWPALTYILSYYIYYKTFHPILHLIKKNSDHVYCTCVFCLFYIISGRMYNIWINAVFFLSLCFPAVIYWFLFEFWIKLLFDFLIYFYYLYSSYRCCDITYIHFLHEITIHYIMFLISILK